MMIVVTVKSALERIYGAPGYQQIRAALEAFAEAAEGQVIALDSPDDLSPLRVPTPAGNDAGSIRLTIRAVRRVTDPQASLLLVGGDMVIPFCQMANPVGDRTVDPDSLVATDNPYGTDEETLEQYLAPPVSVGRLPDCGLKSARDFVDLISLATANRQSRPARSGSAVVVNSDWSEQSQNVAAALPGPVGWHLAPGYVLAGANMADADRSDLYFNLHGFSGDPDWKGYEDTRGQYVTAVTPDAFDRQYVSGSVAFAENCYGAQTIGRTSRNSCALRLVREGAAFIGATGLAFGSHLVPGMFLEDADYLARSFFSYLYGDREELGTALRHARSDYLADTTTPASDPYKQKTLLQFVLLGDPGWS